MEPSIGCLVRVGSPVNLPADDVELLRPGRLADVDADDDEDDVVPRD